MRCHYCHNSNLFDLNENNIPLENVLLYIAQNKKMLDGVVISGGEPTLDPNLSEIIGSIRKVAPDLKIKLDTNGTNFDVVKKLVDGGMADYVALDVKAPAAKHKQITGLADMVRILRPRNTLNRRKRPDICLERPFRRCLTVMILKKWERR